MISACRRPSGFTLTEMMIVGGLTGLLVLLISDGWWGLGRPSTDALARCRLAQEANLAAASLARDFGGSLPGQVTGPKEYGRLVGGHVVDGTALWLCYDGEPANGLADWGSPDTVITYEVQDNRLIRSNKKAETVFAVAADVARMQLKQQLNQITIGLTFSFREFTQTYTFVADSP